MTNEQNGLEPDTPLPDDPGDEDPSDEALDELVTAARDRLRIAFKNGEIDGKTAAQIVLADMRLKEKRRPADDGDGGLLEKLREDMAKTFGVNRTTTQKKARARGTRH